MENTLKKGEVLLTSRLNFKHQNKQIPFYKNDILIFRNEREKYFVKRCLGMPGEVIFFNSNTLDFVNSPPPKNSQIKFDYYVKVWNQSTFNENNPVYDTVVLKLNLDQKAVFDLANNDTILSIDKSIPSITKNYLNYQFIYKAREAHKYDSIIKILIPKKDLIINLNNRNINLYKESIVNECNCKLYISNDRIYLDNGIVTSYKFKQDYCFMVGDNRDHSLDSRSFGFVPVSNIEGKVILNINDISL